MRDTKNFIRRKNFRLYKEDCLKVLKKIPEESIDFIITDPPYNLGLFMKNRQTNINALRNNHFAGKGWDDLEYDQWKDKIESLFLEFSKKLRKGKSLVMFMAIIKVETVVDIAQKYGFYYKCTGIWHKTNPMPRNKDLHFINSTETWIYFTFKTKTSTFNNNGKAIHDFYETSLTRKKEKKYGGHPTQKPESLLTHLVSLLSNEGDMVLDPFMGSGSAGVSSLKLKRKFIGIELDEEYYDLAKRNIISLSEED